MPDSDSETTKRWYLVSSMEGSCVPRAEGRRNKFSTDIQATFRWSVASRTRERARRSKSHPESRPIMLETSLPRVATVAHW